MAISSPGIGSGLDVNSIVSQLVALERRPIELLQAQKTKLNTQLSSYGLLQSYMVNMQSAAGVLAKADFWSQTKAASSAADAVSVTSAATASAATYRVEVSSLAQAHSLSSEAFAVGSTATVGTGTLRIQVGSSDVSIAIGTEDQTLAGIRDKINGAEAGVTASILSDALGARLVITGKESGAANAVTITAPVDDTGGLAALTFSNPPAAGGMTERLAAQNAAFSINGLPLSSASNTLTDVIDGVSLTLSKAATGPVDITVGNDTGALRKGITDFVAAYNETNRYLAQQTKFDPASSTAGALQGDRAAVSLQSKLRMLVQQSSEASASFPYLSDLGLELQRDGSIKINDTKLGAALANPVELSKAF
ncbi:MAG: flagellar filament capping protein FliD, partial [Methylibium sp.]|nr:flagellar filament capping protein FliD [Methylibium sp.]